MKPAVIVLGIALAWLACMPVSIALATDHATANAVAPHVSAADAAKASAAVAMQAARESAASAKLATEAARTAVDAASKPTTGNTGKTEPTANPAAGPDKACQTGTSAAIQMAILKAAGALSVPGRVAVVPRFTRVPAGGPMTLVLSGDQFAPDTIANYRIVTQFHADPAEPSNIAMVDGWQVAASAVPQDYLPKSTPLGKSSRLLSFTAPENPRTDSFTDWWWHRGTITVAGCNEAGTLQFIARMPANFSNRATSLAIALLVTITLYVLAALAIRGRDNRLRRPPDLSRIRALDPVVLSSDASNQGSMSRLQLLFFSVLVFTLLFYLLLRIGLLSDISSTILLLLGISATGAAASKVTETSQTRLQMDNWAWLVEKGWLNPNGLAWYHTARWSDILKGGDGFDVYHFQMLIFSIAVGLALLQTGFSDLSTFEVPEKLLGVLGLSQAVYIGGKLVNVPAIKDLDDVLTELLKREAAFVKAALQPLAPQAITPAPVVAAGQTQPVPPVVQPAPLPPLSLPPDLATARLRAPAEYAAYDEQMKKAGTVFVALYPDVQAVTPMPIFIYRYV